MKIIKHIWLILILCNLVACGFHMYSKDTLPPQLHKIYFQADNPNGQLEVAIKNALRSANVELVADPQAAPVILHVYNTSFIHDNPNVVSTAQATVYNFTYSTVIDLLAKGKAVIVPQTIIVTRTITLDPNEIIDASPEVDTARNEMQREIIFKIFSILNARNTKKALARK